MVIHACGEVRCEQSLLLCFVENRAPAVVRLSRRTTRAFDELASLVIKTKFCSRRRQRLKSCRQNETVQPQRQTPVVFRPAIGLVNWVAKKYFVTAIT